MFIRRYIKLIFIAVVALVGFTWYSVKRGNDYSANIHQITREFTYEMDKKHGLGCRLIGGTNVRNIEKIFLKFHCNEKKSVEEARKLQVQCMERYLEMINAHPTLRSRLIEFPFPSERLEIMICFFEKGLKIFPPEESIGFVISSGKNLIYRVVYTDFHLDYTVLEEPYTEAYAKVKGLDMIESG